MWMKRLLRGALVGAACLALAGCPTNGESDGACEQPSPGASPQPCDDVRDVPGGRP